MVRPARAPVGSMRITRSARVLWRASPTPLRNGVDGKERGCRRSSDRGPCHRGPRQHGNARYLPAGGRPGCHSPQVSHRTRTARAPERFREIRRTRRDCLDAAVPCGRRWPMVAGSNWSRTQPHELCLAVDADAGVPLAFGTDWPIAPLNPLLGVWAAVTRQTSTISTLRAGFLSSG